MAEEQVGGRKDSLGELMPWTRLFTAFKVALDPKKLLLAGAGILAMSFGWWLLSWVFFSFNREAPQWDPNKDAAESWNDRKTARERWNLLYSLAGAPEAGKNPATVDAFDLAGSPEEYKKIVLEVERIKQYIAGKRPTQAALRPSENFDKYDVLLGGAQDATITVELKEADRKALKDLIIGQKGSITPQDIRPDVAANKVVIKVSGTDFTFTNPGAQADLKRLANELEGAASIRDIETRLSSQDPASQQITKKALIIADPTRVQFKPFGRLSTWPWFEYRGPNPYLLVKGNIHSESKDGATRHVPWQRGEFLGWLMTDQAPVLLEPLVKFLTPIIALFDVGSGGWNRLYLFLVILWSLMVWALFGGAITRIAAVQIARPNEKVGLGEAVRFTWTRYRSYLSAPLFPLLFLVILTVFLIFFGWFQAFTFFFGDIFVVALFWPLILLVGLVMAVVLVGLIGWPLMYPTISAEGSDSFDAISRSYSYTYQAPWQYVWYGFLAILYGAVLIFFVGFMGSLMVYMSKWGVSQAPVPASREPTYLFINAPTSFGWRDLLLRGPNAETREVIRNDGTVGLVTTLNAEYMETVTPINYIGTFFMSVWIYILFLMVVGFGYSYFWSASTIIYFLMRRKVDEIELDEVHLEEEQLEEPYPKAPAPTAPPAPAPAPAGAPVMLETPTLRQPSAPPPPSSAPKTMLATEPAPEPPPESKDGDSAKKPDEPGDRPPAGEGDKPQ